jgi:A/G-specific adenine glycosylase
MLQQTQVSRVLTKYPEFLLRFPTIRSLANAWQRDVVVAWQGMGYNNRAVRLHQIARIIVDRYEGVFPSDFASIIQLPGIGKYTAHAILSSAFGEDVPVVDVNIRRFFSRFFCKMRSTTETLNEQEIWKIAAMILPRRNVYRWNQALMDFGATVCRPQKPHCTVCPVAGLCASGASMKLRPVRHSRSEPSRHGIPNRIYRGRIVEELRGVHATRGIAADTLGRRICDGFSERDRPWFNALLKGLRRDGLITVSGNASSESQRVLLA